MANDQDQKPSREDSPIIDFIGIGASRAGSTWVYACLKEHPDICMAEPKEVHFFNKEQNYQGGTAFYAEHFTHCAIENVRGEFTPRYLSSPKAPERIYSHFSDVKLIAVLRNPIEATYSQYFFNKTRDKEGASSFAEALEKSPAEKYIEKRRYYTHLSRFFEYFPREQVLVMIYEDIKKDPVAFMQTMYRFLGVDDTFEPRTAETYINASYSSGKKVKIPYLGRAIARARRLPAPIGTLAKSTLAQKVYHWNLPATHNTKEEKPPMDPKTRAYLQEIYADEIAGVGKLTGRDLSLWK